jgi:hypothetical protein
MRRLHSRLTGGPHGERERDAAGDRQRQHEPADLVATGPIVSDPIGQMVGQPLEPEQPQRVGGTEDDPEAQPSA